MFTTPTGPSRKRSATEAGSVPSGGQSGAALATPSRLRCIADLKGELTCNICLDVCDQLASLGIPVRAMTRSVLQGKGGNAEYLLLI